MTSKEKIEKGEALLNELLFVENVEERKQIIFKDVSKKRPRFKALALHDPYGLFQLLGGDRQKVVRTHNWAYPYEFEEYLQDQIEDGFEKGEAEFVGSDKKKLANQARLLRKKAAYNMKRQSIQRAEDSGNYYVTGLYIIEGANGIKLPFEFAFCEGYLDGMIGTPYNTPKKGNSHGVLMLFN